MRSSVPLYCLVLSSPGEERLALSLLFKCILEGLGWLYSTAGTYAFNELLCFGDVDYALFDVSVVCNEQGFHDVFKDTGCKSFEKEGDGFSISYNVTILSG